MNHDFLKTLNEISVDKKGKNKKNNLDQIDNDDVISDDVIARSQMDEANNFFQDIDDNNGLDKSGSNNIDSRTNNKKEKDKIPADVMAAVNKRKNELKNSIDKFDNKGYNDHSLKAQAIECIDKIVELINNDETQSFNGKKSAQIYFGTLMGPLMDLLPAKLIKFITQ